MKILFTLFYFFQLSIVDHNIPIAIFKIHQVSDNILLDITIDKEDLIDDINLISADFSKEVIYNYLTENTLFSFDNETKELEIKNIEQIGDHLKIKCAFKTITTDIKHLEIENTCLLNIDNQSNIIQIDLNNTTKDYRMHKKRKSISINL